MDDIVRQAMAKWPNVPHCYGWLALDARGNWRMRDDVAQRAGSAGDKLANAALVGFINRNYLCDERGCWYFQNGPQRVYVNLEATPFIARTDPALGFALQTGEALGGMGHAYLTETGEVIVEGDGKVAQVDDRDVAQLLAALELDGAPATDDALMAWLEGSASELALRWRGQQIGVERIARADMPTRFGYVQQPAP